jgi:hypothetical protein
MDDDQSVTTDTTGGRVPDEELVQLGHVEVDPYLLTGPGTTLDAAIGSERHLEVRAAPGELGRLPRDGWRRVVADPDRGIGAREVLAAPLPDGAGTWALVNLAENEDVWILSADPGPIAPHPGRAARRRGLHLRWAARSIAATAGSVLALTIDLRNGSDRTWTNQFDDSATVRGWMSDREGRPLLASSWFAYGHTRSLPALQPGEAVALPISLEPLDTTLLVPGDYQIEACLVALNLHSDAAHVRLT